MDLRSALKPGDLFISCWMDDEVTVLVGDCSDIHAAETFPAPGLHALLTAFEAGVTRADHYTHFIRPEYRPHGWPAPVPSPPDMRGLLDGLAALLVTAALRERAAGGTYRRLLIFPDGVLNLLPFHLLVETAIGRSWREAFPEGVLYAPSASAYVHACAKRRAQAPRRAVVLVGDTRDADLLREAETVARHLPCEAPILTRASELQQTAGADLLYIATHGKAPAVPLAGGQAGRRPGDGWSLLFDGGTLGSEDFFTERVKLAHGSVVVMSACSVGHLMAGPVHELDGLIQAVFYAGAATVLAARWPILYEAAEDVFAGTLDRTFRGGMTIGAALTAALEEAMARKHVQEVMAGPEAETFFWGPFALFGSGC